MSEGKERKPGEDSGKSEATDSASSEKTVLTDTELAKSIKEMKLKDILTDTSELTRAHDFWDTQPVPKLTDDISLDEIGSREERTVDVVRKGGYTLPKGFEWVEIDVLDDTEIQDVYELLKEHYVEDEDAMFRFHYSIDFLRWALLSPGWRKDWHVGVRVSTSRKLVAFISAIPAVIKPFDKKVQMVEVNFLCVYSKLRSKKLAPVLIKEVTRRVNLTGIWQALYTSGTLLPTPFMIARYYHRSLNPKKLVEVGFSSLKKRETPARMQKLYKLPAEVQSVGCRRLKKADVPKCKELLEASMKDTNIAISVVFSVEDLEHWIIPRDHVIHSYVVEDPKSKEVTDFFSFYELPSTVLRNPKYDEIKVAYCFYYAARKTDLVVLLRDMLITAKSLGFDVFNSLKMSLITEEVLKELKFGPGDGELHYYFYNYTSPTLDTSKINIVML